MTVESTSNRAQYATNGTTGPWTVPFYFLEDDHIQVIHTDSDGNETVLTLTTHYSVTGVGDPAGGTVTTVSAYAAGGYITILRNVSALQQTDWRDGDRFPAEVIEQSVDKLTMIAQQLLEVINRALVFAPSDTSGSALPAVAVRANKLLGFNALGQVLMSAPADGTAASLAISLADTASAGNGDALIGVKSTATDAVATTQHEVNERSRNICDWLSAAQIADAKARTNALDCSAAVATAISWCIANHCSLEIPYRIRLASAVNIDRAESASYDEYFTIFSNNGGGFYVSTAIAMFSSSIAFTTAPVTALVRFSGIYFEASSSALAAYVLDDARFLRTKFESCDFSKIKCLSAPTVITQSIYFFQCNMRRWAGTFFSSLNVSFDIKFQGNIVEAGAEFARLAFPVGCSFLGNLIEGMSSNAIRYWGAQGLAVDGNYFEQNDCDLNGTSVAAESSLGVSVHGNYFSHTAGGAYAPSSQYAVKWGKTENGSAKGNYGTTYLHDLASDSNVSINDYAVTAVTNRPGGSVYFREAYDAPAFSARADVDQSITTSTFTKITFGTEEFDTNANFATSTFTPTVPGLYQFDGVVKVAGTNITRVAIGLYKNGAELQRLHDVPLASVASWMAGVSGIVSMNGSTDYIELWVYVVATTPIVDYAAATDTSRFSARYLRNNS